MNLRISWALVAMAAVAGCAGFSTRTPADIGGVNYNRGTFACKDEGSGLESRFTFGASTATFVLKGKPVAMDCQEFSEADRDLINLFRNSYKNFADLCQGHSDKGTVVAGTSNSMGLVQMTALLLDGSGHVKANSLLNCTSAPSDSNGW